MNCRLIVVAAVLFASIPVGVVSAQKLKISSLLPFKKQTSNVQPFQLTDQARGKSALFSNGPIRNLLKPGGSGNGNALEQFNQKSKSFLGKTGESISKFATDTRDTLKNLESPGWNFQESKPWWNGKHNPDVQAIQRDIGQLPRILPDRNARLPGPQPGSVLEKPPAQPRHRF